MPALRWVLTVVLSVAAGKLFLPWMIRVEEARQLLLTIVRSMPAEVVSLRNAIGRVLAADIRAPLPIPLFDQSAVDGYVLSSRRLPDGSYRVVGMIRAGDIPPKTIQSGRPIASFTGAAVPPRAYGVVMQGACADYR